MRAPSIGTIAIVCLGLTAEATLLTAHGQYSRPGEIGANHVTVDNRVEVTGTVAIDPAKAVAVRAVRQPWDYRTLTIGAGKDPTAALAAAGSEGWEAVGIQPGAGGATVLLKRPR